MIIKVNNINGCHRQKVVKQEPSWDHMGLLGGPMGLIGGFVSLVGGTVGLVGGPVGLAGCHMV